MLDVATGTVVVYSDIACPWSHLCVHRLLAARSRLGMDGRVLLDHRAFPLELVNRRPTPKRVIEAELPVAAGCEPGAGWQVWQRPDWQWPVTTLPALEAVQAAKEQGLGVAEQLDRALRVALFAESRCISMTEVILEVAEGCPAVDAGGLRSALADGRARRLVIDQYAAIDEAGVEGSPHVFLAGGEGTFNPGISMHWEGPHERGVLIIDEDDPSVYDTLISAALDPAGATTAG
ncbi:MAG: DsbA family protein [Candidatus Dormibacteria bacterium]